MKTLTVDLGHRSYPIHIGTDLLSRKELVAPHVVGQKIMLVSNTVVADLYLDQALELFSGYHCDTVILPDGEVFKTLETLQTIFDQLLEKRHDRTTTLIALGGGVVGDMTGFAAACYQRGVNFIQIPTTLLAQVDSSVGGKTAVNHPKGKNMIGAFHQPVCVLADINVLATLPDSEFSAGLAEVIKYGLIRDRSFFEWIEKNTDQLLSKETQTLAQAIEISCLHKAEIVAEDEKEQGVRALLNLGHTFGHAIEATQGYGRWLHGEAVAAGTVMAADLSCREGWLSDSDRQRIVSAIRALKLPTEPPADMTESQFRSAMSVDKKVLDGTLRLVLFKAIGDAIVTSKFSSGNLSATLRSA